MKTETIEVIKDKAVQTIDMISKNDYLHFFDERKKSMA